MKTTLKVVAIILAVVALIASGVTVWYLHSKQPVREGNIRLKNLKGVVTVIYDNRGVPHIRAQNESDMYRALGYVHAQDRLFQMEILRRLARGELAEVFGPDMLASDKLFRTLGLRARAEQYVANTDRNSPAYQALLAYLDGINHYIANRKPPLEFDALGIPKRAFTPQDTFAVLGYMAYASAAAFKTEPAMTYVRDKLGPQYLQIFDINWHPEGILQHDEDDALGQLDWNALNQLAEVSHKALSTAGIPMLEGSNGWVIHGTRTLSGKPLLAGDPHHRFAIPSVWYEAHISNPNFQLYGHFQALNPMAMLGHNFDFGWTTTMFQNDDVDLIAETTNPANPNQVLYQGAWVDLQSRNDIINVKGAEPVKITLRTSPHGPIVTDAFAESLGKAPVAMWWTFLQTENPLLQAFYELNRADTRAKARNAASKIEAPGINILWANAKGDIAWWAAAKIPQRPDGVNPSFILDAAKGEAEKQGYYFFAFNPQEENPQRGYIVSANQQPQPPSGVPVPGYYNPPDRARKLNTLLSDPHPWSAKETEALQLQDSNDYALRLLKHLLPALKAVITEPDELAFLQPFEKWQGDYSPDIITPTLFNQLMYELAHAAMADEMGEAQFNNLLQTRLMESALLNLAQDPQSPWWNNVNTPATETHLDTIRTAWGNTMAHLRNMHGSSLLAWRWGKNHTLQHMHPLGQQKYWGWLLNVGPFAVSGGRETPNNMSHDIRKAPWSVTFGPSTRRIIDFSNPAAATGVSPLGQSGVPYDKHYDDQAGLFAASMYGRMYLDEADISKNTESTLTIHPSR